VEVLFNHRRKKIKNSLVYGSRIFNRTEEKMESIAQKTRFGNERVEDLRPEEIGEIADEIFNELNKSF
jgi:16S rRNA A1518/A1519 N6-dimethyltransferase RsmA/KsgA/DIM1 with predicted DNA glycosylase/AP lyase activity